MLNLLLRTYNRLIEWRAFRLIPPRSGCEALDAIRLRALRGTDIGDHLEALFIETLLSTPKLVVELGVRGGESTYALHRAVEMAGATLVGVDIDDCRGVMPSSNSLFQQSDDVVFAAHFREWTAANALPPTVDVLFIDTSHLLEHTRAELAGWLPLIGPGGKAIFHDTNLRRWSRRKSGAVLRGWDNQRGVIRAIEEYVGASFDETRPFTAIVGPWLIKHVPFSHGLTIMNRWAELTGAHPS